MHRVVVDTVIFVRSLLRPYSPSGRLLFARSGSYTLVLSPPIIRKILEVLQRPEITRKVQRVGDMDLSRVLDVLAQAEIIEIGEILRIARDPKDDVFLATALLGKVDYLVSEDRDLLDLVTYEHIHIVNAATFLDILSEQSPP